MKVTLDLPKNLKHHIAAHFKSWKKRADALSRRKKIVYPVDTEGASIA